MATQMQQAREGRITDAMKIVAQEEHIPVETIRERVANGTIAICANVNHENLRPRGVGEGLRVKVNANIGTSSTFPDIEPELEKLDEAVRCGADAVMDLSTGNNIDISRQRIIEHSPIMVGTVPLYQATVRSIREHGAVVEMTDDDILETIEQQAHEVFVDAVYGLLEKKRKRILGFHSFNTVFGIAHNVCNCLKRHHCIALYVILAAPRRSADIVCFINLANDGLVVVYNERALAAEMLEPKPCMR